MLVYQRVEPCSHTRFTSFHPCIWKPQRSPMSTCMDQPRHSLSLRRYSTPEQSEILWSKHKEDPFTNRCLSFVFQPSFFNAGEVWPDMANLRNMKSCFNHYHPCNVQQIAPLQSLHTRSSKDRPLLPDGAAPRSTESAPGIGRCSRGDSWKSGAVASSSAVNLAPVLGNAGEKSKIEHQKKQSSNVMEDLQHIWAYRRLQSPFQWQCYHVNMRINHCISGFFRFQPKPIWGLKIRWGIIMVPTHWPLRGVARFQTTTSHTKRQLFGIKLLEALSRLKIWCFKGAIKRTSIVAEKLFPCDHQGWFSRTQ